jgi:hypothetical protein
MASNITVDTLTKGSTTLNTDEIVDTNSSQVCKAWVNFNGTNTVAIRDSYNVSSITDVGTGNYDVNFTNNMANVNYSAVGQAGGTSGIPTTKLTGTGGSLATNKFTLQTINTAVSTSSDWANIYAQVFGD